MVLIPWYISISTLSMVTGYGNRTTIVHHHLVGLWFIQLQLLWPCNQVLYQGPRPLAALDTPCPNRLLSCGEVSSALLLLFWPDLHWWFVERGRWGVEGLLTWSDVLIYEIYGECCKCTVQLFTFTSMNIVFVGPPLIHIWPLTYSCINAKTLLTNFLGSGK